MIVSPAAAVARPSLLDRLNTGALLTVPVRLAKAATFSDVVDMPAVLVRRVPLSRLLLTVSVTVNCPRVWLTTCPRFHLTIPALKLHAAGAQLRYVVFSGIASVTTAFAAYVPPLLV